jgi:hypothetical protein
MCPFLARGAKVIITSNVAQHHGLCNGTTGIVKDIVYHEPYVNEEDSDGDVDDAMDIGDVVIVRPPGLPKYVWVDVGDDYTGPTYFPGNALRKGWVPIHPITATEYSSSTGGGPTCHERTMLPLRLAWAWTWKAQGQTFKTPIVLNLGEKERDHGLTYVAFSRASRLSLIGIRGGFSKERFTSKIKNHAKMKPRIKEETRLRALASETLTNIEVFRENRRELLYNFLQQQQEHQQQEEEEEEEEEEEVEEEEAEEEEEEEDEEDDFDDDMNDDEFWEE